MLPKSSKKAVAYTTWVQSIATRCDYFVIDKMVYMVTVTRDVVLLFSSTAQLDGYNKTNKQTNMLETRAKCFINKKNF